MTTRRLARHLLLVLLTATTACVAATEDSDEDSIDLKESELWSRGPAIPEALAAPQGNVLAFALHAEGVQIYDCKAGADGKAAWVFRAPEADLFGLFGRFAGTHYAGPTWESLDGSTVVGTRVASVTVEPTAIPWLLLQGSAHTGKGRMSNVTFIQRVNTTGGVAPASGCDESTSGAVAEVDYTAKYNFYRANWRPHRP